jgi:hypothetical protein
MAPTCLMIFSKTSFDTTAFVTLHANDFYDKCLTPSAEKLRYNAQDALLIQDGVYQMILLHLSSS